MKRTVLVLVGLLVAGFVFAQNRPQTLLGDGVEYTSGFGGFMIQFAPIGGEFAAMTGGGGAVLINNAFYFGGYGLGSSDDIRISTGGQDYEVSFDHGGLMMGFVVRPTGMVHLGVSSKVGWGDITYNLYDTGGFGFVGPAIRDNVFVISPQIEAEVNMTSWFKINASVGYQLTNGVNNFYYASKDFDGTTIGLSFLFGWFR